MPELESAVYIQMHEKIPNVPPSLQTITVLGFGETPDVMIGIAARATVMINWISREC